jgi:hypothetical protein
VPATKPGASTSSTAAEAMRSRFSVSTPNNRLSLSDDVLLKHRITARGYRDSQAAAEEAAAFRRAGFIERPEEVSTFFAVGLPSVPNLKFAVEDELQFRVTSSLFSVACLSPTSAA